jgi:homoserine dehydrogenase
VSAAPLKVAVAGLGTVGGGVVRLLAEQADLIAARCGRRIELVAASALECTVDLGKATFFADAAEMVEKTDADVIIELIGGSGGIAKKIVERAIARKRHVVTANKAMLAHYGMELFKAAEEAGVTLGFEASVAGGIPIIKALREGLAANRFSRVYGIMNGTCNYILTTMREQGRDFGEVLAEAQKLGYAEADPSFDIDGIDTAHKLALLASAAFSCPIDFPAVHVEGIRNVSALDIEFADELGYRIKLLGIARLTDHGIERRVHPCLVPITAPIAHVDGVFNAVVTEGDFVGRSVFEGRGAGAGPTASAVVADLMDIARGVHVPALGAPISTLSALPISPMDKYAGAYYMRLMVADKPGVFAHIAAALAAEQVSMERIIQRGRAPGGTVPVVMTVHETEEATMRRAIKRISDLGEVSETNLIRIEAL